MFEPCNSSAICDLVCEETLDSERIGDSTIVGVRVEGFYDGEAMGRDAQAWIELCVGDFAMLRTCAARYSPLSKD